MEDNTNLIQIDGHVHLYPLFDVGALFNAALSNFERQQRVADIGNAEIARVLCLTEGEGYDVFSQWQAREAADTVASSFSDWRISSLTGVANLLRADSHQGQTLYLLQGRQIVTTENIEVLALGLGPLWGDRERALDDVVSAVREAGGIAVIPWGFGKWWGKRGRAIRRHLVNSRHAAYLADNGNRGWFMPTPVMLRHELKRGRLDVKGSDPLPLRGEELNVGATGLMVKGSFSTQYPVESIEDSLKNGDVTHYFQRQEKLARFARNQVAMQKMKRNRPTQKPLI